MDTIKNFLKSYKYIVSIVFIVVVAVAFLASGNSDEVNAESLTAHRSDVSEEVSVTGRVSPVQHVNLAVQSGGKVTSISTREGQVVYAGQVLLRVDTADLQIRLGRQQATLEKMRLSYSKQEPGALNAADDLRKAYEDGFNTVSGAFLDIPSIVLGLDSVLSSAYLSNNTIISYGDTAREYRNKAWTSYHAAKDEYEDVLETYREASRESDGAIVESLILETYEVVKLVADATKSLKNFVDYIENESDGFTPAGLADDKITLNTYTQETNGHVSDLLNIKNAIKLSEDSILDETSDTESSAIDIRQAELDIQDTLVQISNRTIRAPASGVVTSVDVEVGETISQGTPVISIISTNKFEIEANIPEADIAKVSVGADTDVTLDAYDSDTVFAARVVSISPAETLVDGVATYKTRFQFVESDERIRSGMTASLIISGQKIENVIAIPQRSVITRDGRKLVRIIVDGVIEERTVETGLRGSDGNVEIVSGIEEGEEVVIFSDNK